jgi:hypothetical protein
MKKLIFCMLIIISASTGLTRSQNSSDVISDKLEKLYGRLRSDSDDSIRLRINDSIKLYIENFVNSDEIFTRTFSDLRYLGQITSPDSLIKIITWNLLLTKQPGRYYCYFIRKSSVHARNIVYFLTQCYNDNPILTDTIYTQSDWYGALYYDIRPCFAENKQSWVLLGINFCNPLMTRKVIDVLSFTPEDKITFGRKWFSNNGSINFRHVLEYSSGAVISLRFSQDNSVIFNHLVPLPPLENDDRIYNGPDYSYDAFIFSDGLWNMSLNIDARNSKK